MGLSAALARFNAAHPWSHNDAYMGFVTRQAKAVRRSGGTRVLDVGCGTGNLLMRLVDFLPDALGVEPDAATASLAATRLAASTARIENRPFRDEKTDEYDLITFIASLHHMPLRSTLETARAAIRTGGRIVIVGIAREVPSDAIRSLVSMLLNPLVGIVRHPRRADVRPAHMQAPVADASATFAQIQAVASDVLPGIRMRQRLFWRYTAVWIAS